MSNDWQDPTFESEQEDRNVPAPRLSAGRGLSTVAASFRRHHRRIVTVAAILLPVLVLSTILYTALFNPQAHSPSHIAAPTRIYDRNHVLLWTMPRTPMTTPTAETSSAGQKRAPHFVDYVVNQLALMLTDDGTVDRGMQILRQSGLQVYTTIDVRLEDAVEQTVQHYLIQPYTLNYDFETGTFPPLSAPQSQGGHNIHDAAVVVTDPQTGDILAMDGSGDYNNDNHDNYVDPHTDKPLSYDPREGGSYNAAIAYRQAGPAFMPIVYAAAIEEGWFPSLVLRDQLTCFPIQVPPNSQSPQSQACGHWYAPINTGGQFMTDDQEQPPTMAQGVRIRSALSASLNIPAVQALYFAGLDNAINLAHRMGIYGDPSLGGAEDTFSDKNKGPSIALGFAGMRLLDMVNAYSVFANGGYHLLPRAISRITNAQGQVIAGGDFQTVTKTQVLSPQTAFLITNILADNTARARVFGANNALQFNSIPAAATTGITADFKDSLTVGYTPSLAVGVWTGNANDESMSPNTLPMIGAAPIWHDVVMEATQLLNTPNAPWSAPPGVSQQSVDGATGLPPQQGQQGNYTDWFNDAEVPSVP
jgi:membrane peptidoglycan carboxypeptidase